MGFKAGLIQRLRCFREQIFEFGVVAVVLENGKEVAIENWPQEGGTEREGHK